MPGTATITPYLKFETVWNSRAGFYPSSFFCTIFFFFQRFRFFTVFWIIRASKEKYLKFGSPERWEMHFWHFFHFKNHFPPWILWFGDKVSTRNTIIQIGAWNPKGCLPGRSHYFFVTRCDKIIQSSLVSAFSFPFYIWANIVQIQ